MPEGEKIGGVPVLRGGQNLPPPLLDGLGLTNLPNIGRGVVAPLGSGTPAPKF